MNGGVLVVDDHPLVRDVVRTMLEARGYVVATARDGVEALELVHQNIPAVAIIDVDMPGPNGVEVCRSLRDAARAQGSTLPVWLMTGVERPGLLDRAKVAGALGVLPKPFTLAQLTTRLEHALGRLHPDLIAA